MNPEQLLEQLAPLRAPDAIGFLPLAPGWWAVIAILAIALGTLLYLAFRRYQRAAYRRAGVQWLTELEADSARCSNAQSRVESDCAEGLLAHYGRWIVWR